MKNKVCVVFCVMLIIFTGCSTLKLQGVKESVYDGPLLIPEEGDIPGVPKEVQYEGFWERKAGNPDEVMMTPDQIRQFNERNPLKDSPYIVDVLNLPAESIGENIREYISANARYLADATLYVTGDIQLEQAQRQQIIALMDTSGVRDIISVRFGVMLRRVEGKAWPTIIPLMSSPNSIEFDAGIVASLDMGEPVALLHVSRDGQWSYIQNQYFTCWVPSNSLALGDIETIKTLTVSDDFLLVVGHRVSIYGTPEPGPAIGSIQMGSTMPLSAIGNDYCAVLIPGRGDQGELSVQKGYIRRDSNVSLGYLPYTLRNVYRQCFRLYGRRYGWGGMFEERDCSGFVLDVFRCFGFKLPRNSSRQAEASTAIISLSGLDRETKLQSIINSPGGISLLRMSGHIMIYLGHIDGKPYAIHDMWGWRKSVAENLDATHRVARVTVTDLMLGDGSLRGTFLDRLTHITILGNYTIENQ
ncbi:MAG: SH3 domain-containing protein [Candidatus Latescibacteria bacterium]|nr:SH3 domain-containing protein [Candidatus Latescibacterota bacterium]